MLEAEHWMDGSERVIGLTGIQYMSLLIGLALVSWLMGRWFRRK